MRTKGAASAVWIWLRGCLLLWVALSGLPLVANAAETAANGFSIAATPVTEKPLPDFPFVPALEGFRPMAANLSVWNKDTDFARYVFQPATDQSVEVGGRMLMKHFAAIDPARQSTEKIVDSYGALFASLGGVTLYTGRFGGGRIDSAPRSEQQAREGATYLLRTPEREIWAQISVRDEGGEYVLVVLEKGPLVIKTAPLRAADLKRSLDETGKAIIYVNFEYDRADLKPDAKPVLDEVAAVLKSDARLKLSIEGHTDNVGRSEYNQALSERRAAAVLTSLGARGVLSTDTSRLQSAGRGASTPIADNKTEEGRARNRRVELIKRL